MNTNRSTYATNLIVTIKFDPNKSAPLYFVRSGYIVLSASVGTLRYVGQWGHDWSSRASSAQVDGAVSLSAYDLGVYDSVVEPSNGPFERWVGRSLRCLSTVLDI